MPAVSETQSNRKWHPSGMDQWDERLEGQFSMESDQGRPLLEGSRRSTSSRTATETCTTTDTGSINLPNQLDAVDGSKKKKKKEKKKKKSKTTKDNDKKSDKKKKKKARRKEMMSEDDDNQSTVTKCDEKLVDELCSFLSNTLCSETNTESFLRLLRENSVQGTYGPNPEANDDAQYGFLQSPDPSVCDSNASHHFSTPSSVQSALVHGRPQWTPVDPPSILSAAHSNQSVLRNSQPEPSIRSPAPQFSRKPMMESAEVMSPLHTITCSLKGATKFENKSKSVRKRRHPVTVSEVSMSERRMRSNNNDAVSDSKATPEDLLFALPQEFRMHLLNHYAEELQNGPTSKIAQARNEDFLMSCRQSSIPLETRGDRDALSVVSDLSALTGVVSYASKPIIHCEGGLDESSADSDDSDDGSQSSGPDLPPPSFSSHVHDHRRVPRRSSLSVQEGMKAERRRVGFEFVHIREFDTVLDCNPAVTEGPAIALGWKVITEEMFMVSDHDNGRHRRYGDELMLSTHTREGILLRLGCTHAEIDAAVRRTQKSQNQRRRTAQKVRMDSLEFAMERVGKRFRHLLTGGGGNSKSKVQVS